MSGCHWEGNLSHQDRVPQHRGCRFFSLILPHWTVCLHPCVCVTGHCFGPLHKSEISLIKAFSLVLAHRKRKGISSTPSAAFPFGVAFSDRPSQSGHHEGFHVPLLSDTVRKPFEKYCHKVAATALSSVSSQSFLHSSLFFT